MVLYVRSQYTKYCEERSLKEIFNLPFRIGITRGIFYGKAINDIQNMQPPPTSMVYAKNREELIRFVEQVLIDGFFEDPTVLAFEQRISNRDFVLEKCKIASYSALSLMFTACVKT